MVFKAEVAARRVASSPAVLETRPIVLSPRAAKTVRSSKPEFHEKYRAIRAGNCQASGTKLLQNQWLVLPPAFVHFPVGH
jgi:hypothetical protein